MKIKGSRSKPLRHPKGAHKAMLIYSGRAKILAFVARGIRHNTRRVGLRKAAYAVRRAIIGA